MMGILLLLMSYYLTQQHFLDLTGNLLYIGDLLCLYKNEHNKIPMKLVHRD